MAPANDNYAPELPLRAIGWRLRRRQPLKRRHRGMHRYDTLVLAGQIPARGRRWVEEFVFERVDNSEPVILTKQELFSPTALSAVLPREVWTSYTKSKHPGARESWALIVASDLMWACFKARALHLEWGDADGRGNRAAADADPDAAANEATKSAKRAVRALRGKTGGGASKRRRGGRGSSPSRRLRTDRRGT